MTSYVKILEFPMFKKKIKTDCYGADFSSVCCTCFSNMPFSFLFGMSQSLSSITVSSKDQTCRCFLFSLMLILQTKNMIRGSYYLQMFSCHFSILCLNQSQVIHLEKIGITLDMHHYIYSNKKK